MLHSCNANCNSLKAFIFKGYRKNVTMLHFFLIYLID
nr:MAG TPA: hypothetical protein [Caudoviricetes sp.]